MTDHSPTCAYLVRHEACDCKGIEHWYFSTGCGHLLHERCRKVCKFCPAECACTCHGADE